MHPSQTACINLIVDDIRTELAAITAMAERTVQGDADQQISCCHEVLERCGLALEGLRVLDGFVTNMATPLDAKIGALTGLAQKLLTKAIADIEVLLSVHAFRATVGE